MGQTLALKQAQETARGGLGAPLCLSLLGFIWSGRIVRGEIEMMMQALPADRNRRLSRGFLH